MARITEHWATREQWLESAADYLYTDFIGELAHMGKGENWQVSCGWPSSRALSASRRRTGECWFPEACADKTTHHIFISPIVDQPVEVLGTLLHELIHAVTPGAGHKGAFKRIALAVGLEGKMTATVLGPELLERLNDLARRLGPYPHKQLSATNRKKQATRLIKLEAVKCCGYVVRSARAWIETGLPKCPHGSPMREVA